MKIINNSKGLRFIGRKKAVIDVSRHADIMEDVIDRITIKEAKNDATVSWDEVKRKIDKKLGVYAVSNTTNKTSRKKSSKGR